MRSQLPKAAWREEGEYTVAVIAFKAEGFDNYTPFKDLPSLVAMRETSLLLLLASVPTGYT